MTTLQPSMPQAQIRDFTRRGVPLHFAPAAIVTVLSIAMLFSGGVIAGFGGWLLAAALPIAIGGFLRSPWFAAAPPAVWTVWLIIAGTASPDARLAHTPVVVAVMLAAIGAGATLLAQRAIFPATDPEVWEAAAAGRATAASDDAGADAPGEPETSAVAFEPITDADDLAGGILDGFEETDADELGDLVGDVGGDDAPAVAAAEVEHVAELPLGADPAPLDEGGHVTDFPAITPDA